MNQEKNVEFNTSLLSLSETIKHLMSEIELLKERVNQLSESNPKGWILSSTFNKTNSYY